MSLFVTERQVGKLYISILIVLGLTRPGIEPLSNVLIAEAPNTRLQTDRLIDVGYGKLLGNSVNEPQTPLNRFSVLPDPVVTYFEY